MLTFMAGAKPPARWMPNTKLSENRLQSRAQICNNVRRGRRDQQQIGALRHCNMFDRTFQVGFAAGRITEEVGDDFLPA